MPQLRHCLTLTTGLPWPVVAGGRLRDWQNVSILTAVADVSVVGIQGRICHTPPRTSISVSAWTTLDAELRTRPMPYDPGETVLKRDWWNNENGHPADELWSPFRAAALRRFLRSRPFDFAIVEDITLWRYASIVEEFCDIVVDCHNVQSHLEREYLTAASETDSEARSRHEVAFRTMQTVEAHYRSRRIPMFVCSELERAHLMNDGYPSDRVHVVYNALDTDGVGADVATDLRAQPTILFPGVMSYRPNADAALTLVREIFPRVKETIPGAVLRFVGPNPTAELLREARGRIGVEVYGEVDDMQPFFASASVVCVPLTMGGGTRFKILEAFLHGVPVVTTPKGCEGLMVEHGRHLIVGTTSGEQSDAIIDVMSNPSERARLVAEGQSLVRTRYSRSVAKRQMLESLTQLGMLEPMTGLEPVTC